MTIIIAHPSWPWQDEALSVQNAVQALKIAS